jgi:hypothetical protein
VRRENARKVGEEREKGKKRNLMRNKEMWRDI